MNEILGRVAFTIGTVDIYWYGIIIATSILIAFALSFALLKVKGLPKDLPIDIFLAIIPLGIICARLFSVIFDPGTTIADFFKFREGGMSIIGAILGGVIGITILCAVKKYNFLKIGDLIVPVLILAQAIGRWGNFANQEVYGKIISDASWQFFPVSVLVDGQWHMALFFYEFVLNLIGFTILMILYFKTKKTGICTATYLIYYGVIRSILESFRDKQYVLKWGNVPISQLISVLFILAGISIVIWMVISQKKAKTQVEKA
ncbi:MAG: prolipoprotein diacylglyceryl transferase [Clostridia bacterium]|nr:prolipoprotein diacylglyceryl transferase [Clostridia bacterium]